MAAAKRGSSAVVTAAATAIRQRPAAATWLAFCGVIPPKAKQGKAVAVAASRTKSSPGNWSNGFVVDGKTGPTPR